MSTFARFAPRLQEAIVARLGWTSLRPVQELAGEALLDGKNALVLAPTAGGKTEAAIFPTLSRLLQEPVDGVAAIYVAPIKALLNNQAERLGQYTEMVGLRRFVWHGDAPDNERRQFLRDPAELLMTTPESLEVMLISPRVDVGVIFAELRVVIVDEIHAMAGSDRGAHLLSVLERLVRHSRHDVQRIGLSATVGNPDTILAWLQGTSKRASVVIDPPKEPAKRQLLIAFRGDLPTLAHDAARLARGGKSLFFCQSRATTEAVAEQMRRAGTEVFVHHSAVSRDERALAEERFHHGTDACIVCTSTLELGIDVGDLDRVLQHEAPDTVSSFLQRMGRTGRRAGQTANTTFFCETSDGVLQAIALIELAKAGWVERVRLTDDTIDALIAIRDACRADGIIASDRRWKKSLKLVQASAWMAGERATTPEDLAILIDSLWREPKERAKVARLVGKLADPVGTQAAELLDAARETAQKVSGMKSGDRKQYISTAAQAIDQFTAQQSKLAELARSGGRRAKTVIADASSEIQQMHAEMARAVSAGLGLRSLR